MLDSLGNTMVFTERTLGIIPLYFQVSEKVYHAKATFEVFTSSAHCEGFSTASLAVAENGSIVSF